jgi:hypothetical protein
LQLFLFTLTAMACVACGPAKPVLVYAPPSVTIDTAGPKSVNTRIVSRSKTFWEAMSSLDTGFVKRHPATPAERNFAEALGLVMSGHAAEAADALDSVRINYPEDTLIRSASRILMTAMLQYQDKWKELAELRPGARRDTTLHEHDKADVESWASAFRNVPKRVVSYPDQPVVLPLFLSASGSPMITVTINGQEWTLWLDSGSSMSIISSDVAALSGVSPLVKDTLEVATTTGRVSALPAAIDHLRLGGIEVSNATAMIVAAELMQVRLGDGSDPNAFEKIDGVIGFDIMSRLDIRIDYVNRRVTLLEPKPGAKLPKTGRNLFWVGAPVVRLVSSKGVPLHFNLDTGAQETYSTDALISKTRTRTFMAERRLVGGLAGLTVVHGRFIEEMHVTMAGQKLLLKRLLVFAPAFSSFVALDGVLGSDIGRGGIVRIDATNGLFVLEPRPPRRSLR